MVRRLFRYRGQLIVAMLLVTLIWVAGQRSMSEASGTPQDWCQQIIFDGHHDSGSFPCYHYDFTFEGGDLQYYCHWNYSVVDPGGYDHYNYYRNLSVPPPTGDFGIWCHWCADTSWPDCASSGCV